jgi:hypothetical protein
MDSMFAKDSSFHREVDERMVQLEITFLIYDVVNTVPHSPYLYVYSCLFHSQTKNFQLTWDECNLKKVNFDEFETIHVVVPKQNNG